MADSDQNVKPYTQGQEQSTAEWLYDTVANTVSSFLPSWSSSASSAQPAVQQQQAPERPCQKTSAPVCRCNKNKPK